MSLRKILPAEAPIGRPERPLNCKRGLKLSITHKFLIERHAYREFGEFLPAAPREDISGWRIVGTGKIAIAVYRQDAGVVSETVEQRTGELLGPQNLGPAM